MVLEGNEEHGRVVGQAGIGEVEEGAGNEVHDKVDVEAVKPGDE